MRCTSCQSDNPPENQFCEQCGARLEARCPQCGTPVRPGGRFCGACGQRLSAPDTAVPAAILAAGAPHTPAPSPIAYTPRHLAERILAEQQALAARSAPDGERQTITALFADIKGSMALLEDLDPEEARHIIDPALRLMMEAVHRYEGYVAQSLGDGIFALFGAPIAHEDHAQRALYAALRMQEAMAQYSQRLRGERGVTLEIRVGVNTGDVVLRAIRTDDLHTDYVPIGHATSLAARLQSLATGGAIVVSAPTYTLTEGYFTYTSLGTAQVKGVSEPVPLYQVVGVGPLRTWLEMAARRGLVRDPAPDGHAVAADGAGYPGGAHGSAAGGRQGPAADPSRHWQRVSLESAHAGGGPAGGGSAGRLGAPAAGGVHLRATGLSGAGVYV